MRKKFNLNDLIVQIRVQYEAILDEEKDNPFGIEEGEEGELFAAYACFAALNNLQPDDENWGMFLEGALNEVVVTSLIKKAA